MRKRMIRHFYPQIGQIRSPPVQPWDKKLLEMRDSKLARFVLKAALACASATAELSNCHGHFNEICRLLARAYRPRGRPCARQACGSAASGSGFRGGQTGHHHSASVASAQSERN